MDCDLSLATTGTDAGTLTPLLVIAGFSLVAGALILLRRRALAASALLAGVIAFGAVGGGVAPGAAFAASPSEACETAPPAISPRPALTTSAPEATAGSSETAEPTATPAATATPTATPTPTPTVPTGSVSGSVWAELQDTPGVRSTDTASIWPADMALEPLWAPSDTWLWNSAVDDSTIRRASLGEDVVVTLLDANGATVATTLLAPDGSYRFDGVPVGDGYTARFAFRDETGAATSSLDYVLHPYLGDPTASEIGGYSPSDVFLRYLDGAGRQTPIFFPSFVSAAPIPQSDPRGVPLQTIYDATLANGSVSIPRTALMPTASPGRIEIVLADGTVAGEIPTTAEYARFQAPAEAAPAPSPTRSWTRPEDATLTQPFSVVEGQETREINAEVWTVTGRARPIYS